ncbi:hypothetical protein S40288_08826 [Stachybotrys chartarum IBT 40288]|nr:hypothetical protein S40288_08826 [Stachybotrys chartarum IBT 40288]
MLGRYPMLAARPTSRLLVAAAATRAPASCIVSTRAARQRLLSTTPSRCSKDVYDPRERLRNARPLVSHAAADRFSNAGRSRNSKRFAVACVAAAVIFYLCNSEVVPVSGRRRFNFFSDWYLQLYHRNEAKEIIRLVEAQGGRFLREGDPRVLLVKHVMKRLIPVSGVPDYDWEVFVIDDPRTANAFVIPGGKVFVHSGILNVCGNEHALAAVLGHEIAHNTALHAGERLSAAWVGNLMTGCVFLLAGGMPGVALFGLWTAVGGFFLRDLLFYLPMGRHQESEADYLGLMMMAEACYDPRYALTFWQRMEAVQRQGGVEVPEMLSTHPSNEQRIAQITQWMPRALEKRAESDCRGTTAFANQFRSAMRRGVLVTA